jgi:hypothetical protein
VSSNLPHYSLFIARLSFILLLFKCIHLARLQLPFILLISYSLSSCPFVTVSHLAHFPLSFRLLNINSLSSCPFPTLFHLAHFQVSFISPIIYSLSSYHFPLSFISPIFYSLSSYHFPLSFISPISYSLSSRPFSTPFNLAHDYCRESALDELASIAPSDLFEQLFIVALGAGFAVAQSAPQAAQEPLKSCLEKCASYAVETCGRHMGPAKLERLCQVSRGWARSF